MPASVRALLVGVIDYAGLFPPARLPLEPAMHLYARYRQEPEGWMLGRFLCPAARLDELAAYRDSLLAVDPPWDLGVVGRGGGNAQSFQSAVRADVLDMLALRNLHGPGLRVNAYEVRLPAGNWEGKLLERALTDIASTSDPTDSSLESRLAAPGRSETRRTAYFELVPAMAGGQALGRICEEIRAINSEQQINEPSVRWLAGVKLRCGGTEAAAFPAPDVVAGTIRCCRDARVPLKFTAGLHHPVRHGDAGMGIKMHGFLNLFGAGVLAHARPINQEQIRVVIEEEDAVNFRFDEQGFAWKDLSASTEEITAARRELVISFGSCSFDEPRDDLRALGLFD
jgi:hypothetical protein